MNNPKLIIFDVYGTILKADIMDYTPRFGLAELLENYKDAIIVAFTDADESSVGYDLSSSGLINIFKRVYVDRNCVFKSDVNINQERIELVRLCKKNFLLKNLEKVCNDFDIEKKDAVFIGDNRIGRDQDSALYYGIKFIQVPQYREKDPDKNTINFNGSNVFYEPRDFSFMSLIGKL
jgi:hypothetical protein